MSYAVDSSISLLHRAPIVLTIPRSINIFNTFFNNLARFCCLFPGNLKKNKEQGCFIQTVMIKKKIIFEPQKNVRRKLN